MKGYEEKMGREWKEKRMKEMEDEYEKGFERKEIYMESKKYWIAVVDDDPNKIGGIFSASKLIAIIVIVESADEAEHIGEIPTQCEFDGVYLLGFFATGESNDGT